MTESKITDADKELLSDTSPNIEEIKKYCHKFPIKNESVNNRDIVVTSIHDMDKKGPDITKVAKLVSYHNKNKAKNNYEGSGGKCFAGWCSAGIGAPFVKFDGDKEELIFTPLTRGNKVKDFKAENDYLKKVIKDLEEGVSNRNDCN